MVKCGRLRLSTEQRADTSNYIVLSTLATNKRQKAALSSLRFASEFPWFTSNLVKALVSRPSLIHRIGSNGSDNYDYGNLRSITKYGSYGRTSTHPIISLLVRDPPVNPVHIHDPTNVPLVISCHHICPFILPTPISTSYPKSWPISNHPSRHAQAQLPIVLGKPYPSSVKDRMTTNWPPCAVASMAITSHTPAIDIVFLRVLLSALWSNLYQDILGVGTTLLLGDASGDWKHNTKILTTRRSVRAWAMHLLFRETA